MFALLHKVENLFFALLLLLSCYVYIFLLNSATYIDGDAGNGYWAVIAGNAKIFMDGEIPLWNNYLWGGVTNSGSLYGCFYPIFYLLYYVFWDYESSSLSYYFLPTVYFIHMTLYAIGMYFLSKKINGNSYLSFVCALLCTFCGAFLTGFHWAYISIGFSWLPLFILFYASALENFHRKETILASGIIGLIGLGSIPHGLLFSAIVMILICFCFVICNTKKTKNYLIVSLKIGSLGIGLCAVQLFQFVMNIHRSNRYIDSPNGKLDYQEFLRNTVSAVDLNSMLGGHSGWFSLSIFALLLSILSLFYFRKNSTDGLYLFGITLFLTTVMMMLGMILPSIAWHIPGLKDMREQFLWAPLLAIASGILASYAIRMVLERSYKKNSFFKDYGKLTILGIAILASFMPENNVTKVEYIPKVIIFVLIVFVFIKSKIGLNKKIIGYFLLGIYVISEMVVFSLLGGKSVQTYSDAQRKVLLVNTQASKIFEKLNVEKGERVLPWSPVSTFPSNLPSAIGYQSCFAYMNPVYKKNANVHSMDLKLRGLIQNIRFFFVSSANEKSFLDYISEVMKNNNYELSGVVDMYSGYDSETTTPIFVWENNNRNGNAWLVTNYGLYEKKESKESVFAKLSEIDLASTALINENTIDKSFVVNGQSAGHVSILSYRSNVVEYLVDTKDSALLVTSEFYYPGWYVYIDGVSSDLLEVNYAFRGVYVPSGSHVVKFVYFPMETCIGAVISLFTIFVILFIGLFGRKLKFAPIHEKC